MRIERHIVVWTAVLAAAIVAVAALRDILLPFVVAAVLAYALNPIVERLRHWGMSRTAASALTLAGLSLVVAAAVVLLAPPLFDQLKDFARSAPADVQRIREAIDGWAQSTFAERYPSIRTALAQGLSDAAHGWSSTVRGAAARLWTQGLAVVNILSLLLVTPVALFYLMADWPALLARIDSWIPRAAAPTVRALALEIDGVVAAFVRGQGIVCMVLAAFYAVGLTVLGVRYGLLIGVATGVLCFVPFVGWAVGLASALAIAVAQGWPELALAAKVLALFAAGAALDSAVLSPRIVGSRIGLHPLWLIFALLAFSSLLGLLGTLIAVPLAAALGVVARFAIARYLASPYYDAPTPSVTTAAAAADEPLT